MVKEFDDIRPYEDSEVADAMSRIVSNPAFENVAGFLYPQVPFADVKAKFLSFDSTSSFQNNFSDYAIQTIVKMTSSGLSFDGFRHLNPSKKYLFISNHRDILLDAAILQIILVANKHDTSEITFGDNLMSTQFVVDFGKSNKMFRLIRGGTPKQIFSSSMHTSRYIRYTIKEKQQSVWIAQRNGRTKDGNDQTQQAVLKMFGMSGGHDFAQNFAELNIAPTAVSYEYDPCDCLKTREIYISRRQTYVKEKSEDLNSVITGIRQFKGKIHVSVAPIITVEELREIEKSPKTERIQNLTALIDLRMYKNYKLWNTNYIAWDLINGNRFEKNYTAEEKNAFIDYVRQNISKIDGDREELKSIFLRIYANPVGNYLKAGFSDNQTSKDDLAQFAYS
jgi:hypothetical protein